MPVEVAAVKVATPPAAQTPTTPAAPAPAAAAPAAAPPAPPAAPAEKPAGKSAADVAAGLKLGEQKKPDGAVADRAPETKPTEVQPTVYDLKLPEGTPVKGETLAKLQQLANTMKLAPEAAQLLAENTSTLLTAHGEGLTKAAVESLAAEEAAMEKLSREDAHLGGAHFDVVTERISGVLDEFFPEIAESVRSSFWMKHPHARLGFARIAAAMAEGGAPVRGSPVQQAPAEKAAVFFPKMLAGQKAAASTKA